MCSGCKGTVAAADKGDQAEYRDEARIQLPGRENPGRPRDQARDRQGCQNGLDTFSTYGWI